MCGKGEARRIVRNGSGKKGGGRTSPERISRIRYFARRTPWIDLVRMAIRPTRKLIAATRKKERTAENRKRAPAAIETGGRTGKSRPITTAIGRVKRTARNADCPAESAIMTVLKFTGRIRFTASRPS